MKQDKTKPVAAMLLAMGTILLLLGVSARILHLGPERYQAMSAIFTAHETTWDAGTNQPAPDYDPYFIQTEFVVLQSELILDRVVTNLDLNKSWAARLHRDRPLQTSESRALLRQGMDVRGVLGTNVIEIRVTAATPGKAADLANAIADGYLAFRNGRRLEEQAAVTNALQAQLAQLDAKIAAARQFAQDLKENLAVNVPNNGDMNIAHNVELNIDYQAQLAKSEQQYAYLNGLDRQHRLDALTTTTPDAILSGLVQDLYAAQLKLSAAKLDGATNQPDVLHAEAAVADANQRIDGRIQGILAGLQMQITASRAVVTNTQRRIEEAKENERNEAERTRPYNEALQKAQDLEQSRAALKAKIEGLLNAPKFTNVAILLRASPPTQRMPPSPWLVLALVGSGAFLDCLGLMLLFRRNAAELPRVPHATQRH